MPRDGVKRWLERRLGDLPERLYPSLNPPHSAKSVFLFDVQDSVAKSTHTGIPWLRKIKEAVGKQVHFWPFEGWKVPPGKSVIVETYPSLVRHR